jgi:hypothetical protein
VGGNPLLDYCIADNPLLLLIGANPATIHGLDLQTLLSPLQFTNVTVYHQVVVERIIGHPIVVVQQLQQLLNRDNRRHNMKQRIAQRNMDYV